jgi:hypothetical protein
MDLHYSNQELSQIETQILRSIKVLEEAGTIISGQHQLSIIKNLIEENRSLRNELAERYCQDEH